MGEVGEMWDELTKMRKIKRITNTQQSTQLLVENGIEFESKNHGAHLIIKSKEGFIDFWPSTGLFISRKTHKRKRGVSKLINYINDL